MANDHLWYVDVSGGRVSMNSTGSIDIPASQTYKINGVNVLDQKADTSHSHSESDVTNLTTDLASKLSSLTYSSAVLSGNVTMTSANTAYDGPSLSLAAGTWLLIGYVTVRSNSATAQRVTAYIWDGSSAYYASGEAAAPSQGSSTYGYLNINIVGIAVLTGTTTVKLTCKSTAASSTIMRNPGDNSPAGNNASQLVAVKLV